METSTKPVRPSISPVVWQPPKARAPSTQESATYQLEVFPVPGVGPEDVVIDAQGRIITGLADGRILRVSANGKNIEEIARTGGRPLGIELYPDGRLLICDARRGLLRVDPNTGDVETLLTQVFGQHMVFCNNAAIAKDGTVYFSDSSRNHGIDFWRAELMEHSGTGRLFRLSVNGKVDLLLDGLEFANGVALAADESFVTVAETGAYRLSRYWLTGPRAGRSDLLIDRLGGFPDNLSTGGDGLIWITQASPRNKLLDFLHGKHPVLRKLAWAVPEAVQPQPVRTVWVLGVDADGKIVHEVLQPGHDYHMVTGVREHRGDLYLGSLVESAVAVLRKK